MAMAAQDIEALIRETFPEAQITITDLAGDGNHYAAEVTDASFAGKNRALWVIRHEKGQGRGSLPGQGDHEVRADYFSGGAGGGHSGSFRVPKDPQKYAQQFVPKDRKPKDER
jgi:hypothetical protein